VAKTKRSKLLKVSRPGDFRRSTLSWWRSVRISASSEALDWNNPMTARQIVADVTDFLHPPGYRATRGTASPRRCDNAMLGF
jgi:hypothetical protein